MTDVNGWAIRAWRDIPGASLLTHLGDGHGATLSSQCVRDNVERFLFDPAEPVARICDAPWR